ncbi:MAG: Large-conductance mechanosensitive channel, partial [candidate division WS6 bacterium GW2011_GWC1_36_11]|uniref:Large-conductance mechanosensitive channel n=2 Tax=Candidatus Dojkabacteria TaxID=74243 RepID=A0A0G0FDC1_9BACT
MEKKIKSEKIINEGKKLTSEFKAFAFSGATVGAAVGIMMGAALNSVVSSLVKDILTPPIAYLTSGIDFSNLYWVLDSRKFESLAEAQASNAAIIYYGNFITTFISFIITATVLFFIVQKILKMVKKDAKKEEEKK